MRAGRVTGVCDPRQETNASLSQLMIGSLPPELSMRSYQPGPEVLSVRDLRLSRADPFGVDLDGIDLHVRAGEVVGIAGVSGNGQRELLFALSGEDTRAPHESIQFKGQAMGDWGPDERRDLGLHFVPEERLGRGAVPSLSLAQNLLLTRHEAVSRKGG
jgi:simple sugar transport system ATP-binding protein